VEPHTRPPFNFCVTDRSISRRSFRIRSKHGAKFRWQGILRRRKSRNWRPRPDCCHGCAVEGPCLEGDLIPDDQSLGRHCTSSRVRDGAVQGSAFLLRPEEPDLSVNWLEVTDASPERRDQFVAMRLALTESGRTVRPNDWFVALRCGDVTALTELRGTILNLRAVHTPSGTNAGHAGIFGLPPQGSELADLSGIALSRLVTEAPVQSRNL
jgi:hypothetical protein